MATGRWGQDEKAPWERAEAKEEPGSEGDRPSEKPEGGWGGWSSNSWYARPSWSSWSWSYPSYGYSNYGYSSYSGWGDWNRPDAPVEAKQDDSQRQERWSQAFAKDRQEFQDGDWWKSEGEEQPKQEGTQGPKQEAEVGQGQESKWVPPFESGQEASAASPEAKQAVIHCGVPTRFTAACHPAFVQLEASSDLAVQPSRETLKPRVEIDKDLCRTVVDARCQKSCMSFFILERETERESSAAPVLGGLCRLLALGGRWGVNLDCYSRGAFPPCPAVLEHHDRSCVLKWPQSPFAPPDP